MGDRIGLKFRDEMGEESDIIIHSHWMGRDLLKMAQEFYKECDDDTKTEWVGTVTARFIFWMANKFVNYTGYPDIDLQTEDDDCEDNGVWVMDMTTGMIGD